MMFSVASSGSKSGGKDRRSSLITGFSKAKAYEGVGWGIMAVMVLIASMFIAHKVAAYDIAVAPEIAEKGPLVIVGVDHHGMVNDTFWFIGELRIEQLPIGKTPVLILLNRRSVNQSVWRFNNLQDGYAAQGALESRSF